jgi:hypothetical protein
MTSFSPGVQGGPPDVGSDQRAPPKAETADIVSEVLGSINASINAVARWGKREHFAGVHHGDQPG